jgi:hypothetical protein
MRLQRVTHANESWRYLPVMYQPLLSCLWFHFQHSLAPQVAHCRHHCSHLCVFVYLLEAVVSEVQLPQLLRVIHPS